MEKETIESKLVSKLVASTEKVLPMKEPAGCGYKLTGLKGETVSIQIAYKWNGDRTLYGNIEVKPVTVEQLGASECTQFSVNEIRIRKVLLVPCQYTNNGEVDDDYLVTEPGMYPDLLRDMDSMGFQVIPGQWRSLWIDFEIPTSVEDGTYDFSFRLYRNELVQNEETFSCTFSVSLEILDFELPALDIPHTEWFHADCLAQYYHVPVFSEQHWSIIENFVKTAVKRGCNMLYTPLFTPPLDTRVGGERLTVQLVDITIRKKIPSNETASGEAEINSTTGSEIITDETKYDFRFEKFERWIRMGKRCGMKYYEMSHLFTQWGACAAPKIMASCNGSDRQIFGWETDAGGPVYKNFLVQFLRSLRMEIDKLKIRDCVYFHVSDEPDVEQMESYRLAKNQILAELEGYRMIDALSNYDFYESGLVEEPVCATDHLEPFLKEGNRPPKLWVYYCTGQYLDVSNRFIVMPGYRTRVLGLMLYRHLIDGFLHWGFNFYNSQYSLYPINPYEVTDAACSFPAGDPFLVYPGVDGIPEDSIRMMLMDEAFSDYRALILLESLTSREFAIACLQEEMCGELRFDRYPHQNDYVAMVRSRIHEKLKESS